MQPLDSFVGGFFCGGHILAVIQASCLIGL
jgi:hypothetical protein